MSNNSLSELVLFCYQALVGVGIHETFAAQFGLETALSSYSSSKVLLNFSIYSAKDKY